LEKNKEKQTKMLPGFWPKGVERFLGFCSQYFWFSGFD